jgi:hypothetical protein
MLNISITNADVWRSTLLFGVLGMIPLALIILLTPKTAFSRAGIPVVIASAGFWYQYIFPEWLRLFLPFNLILYGGIGYLLWFVAIRLPFHPAVGFAVLGGLEGIVEHLLGIHALGILKRVPWLTDLDPGPVLVFSFFEYVLYWTIVIWLTYFITRLWMRP